MAIPRLIKYCENTYVTGNGTLFEGFETFSDWTKILGDSIEANSINVREGVLSLKLNSVSGGEVTAQKTISQSFSAATNFVIRIYIHQLSTLSNCVLRFSSTTDFSKYFTLTMSATAFKEGWNRMVAAKAQFVDTGGESWSNTMVRMRVECTATGGNNTAASFDELRYSQTGNAKCVLCFDDTGSSIYTLAKPAMDTYGLKGVAFIVTNDVGTGGNMTLTQLKALQTAGWDISSHAWHHWQLDDILHREMEDEVDQAYDWLITNGFSVGAQFFAYPFGAYNDAVLAKVGERHRLARSVINSGFQPHFNMCEGQELLIKATQVKSSDSVATVQGWIDNAITQNGLLVLLFHNIVESGASGDTQYNLSDFSDICYYLAVNGYAIATIILSQYYDQFIHRNAAPPFYQHDIVYLDGAAIVPYPIAHEPSESANTTEGGRSKIYSHPLDGQKKRSWQIKCSIDDSKSYAHRWKDLRIFYWDVLEGGKCPCVFIDSNNIQYLVRIMSFQPRIIAAGNNYEVTMMLEEDYAP